MADQSLISTLEKQYQEKAVENVMRELYQYISAHKTFNSVSAKALVNIITHEKKEAELRRSLLSFVEIVFEDQLNHNKLREADYYVKKALKNDKNGSSSK